MIMDFLMNLEIKRPWHLFLVGLFISSISVFISVALFAHAPSMVVVTFMTLPAIYVFTNILKKKSVQEARLHSIRKLFETNADIAELYLFLFIGMAVGIAFWYSVLSQDLTQVLFSEQLYNLRQIGVSTASATSTDVFMTIAVNNVKLVVLCTIMSFIFGAGALFILSWNASVVGVAMGLLIAKIRAAGTVLPVAIMQGFSMGAAYYILHLVPEVVAYFYASVAGAFIASAMMRYAPFSRNSNRLLGVAMLLLGIAIALILVGAAIETQISHAIQAKYAV
ncbi:MAG: stage II sporulation protein M [Candidatus Aenigmatarchaeota archaeon]